MTKRYTVIGHFDCGCGQAAQPQSLEAVICRSQKEVDQAVERMKQLPEAYLLFPDVDSYVSGHDERKKQDAEWGRGTRAELLERLRQERGGA